MIVECGVGITLSGPQTYTVYVIRRTVDLPTVRSDITAEELASVLRAFGLSIDAKPNEATPVVMRSCSIDETVLAEHGF